MLSMILAMDKNKLVGNTKSNNGLPWHYKEDLDFYKKMTINKKNIMGRKTYDQIGRALPGRSTYVISKNKELKYEDASVINDFNEVLQMNEQNPNEEIMIIGGVEIFELFKPYTNRIYLTIINKAYEGDAYYDNFNTNGYKLTKEIQGDTKELLFQTWDKSGA